MPTARIITRFPHRAGSLRKTLVDSGYRVEIIPPEKADHGFADLEYDLDSMPEFATPVSSGPNSGPETSRAESHPQQRKPHRQFSFAPQLRSLEESLRRHRSQLQQRLSALRSAALERKHAWDAELARRAQLRQQKRAQEQRRLEEELALQQEAQRIAAERAREQAQTALRQKQEREAQRRVQAEAAAQRRQAELAARREAERHAAEQAAMARRQQQEREAERERMLLAQLERRRLEQEKELERARVAAAELAAQRCAEGRSRASVDRPGENKMVAIPQRRRSLQERWDDFTFRIYERMREWRELAPNTEFSNTRDYAWRQAVPAAAGLAIAFAFGWGLAIAGSRTENTLPASPVPAPAIAPAAVQLTPTPTPVAAHVRPAHAKPSPAVRKSNVKVSRRHARDVEPEEDEVVIVRHAPKRELIARSNQKNGVKSISDLE